MTTTVIVSRFTVIGMTCGHCVQAVTAEFGALPGVVSVDVDLPTGSVTVHADRTVGHHEAAAAADEGGYELAS